MSNWDRNFSNGSYPGNWHGRLVYNRDSYNAEGNSSHISLHLQVFADGGYSQNGSWDGRIYVNGNQYARATPSYSAGSGLWEITSWGGDLGHDANGNLYITIGDYINAPINEMTQSAIGWTLPRIALAPSISSTTADTLKPTTARLGLEISSVGHGTSAAMRMYYRIQGVGSYVATPDQNDAPGYNYWTITGLKPGTTYEYYGYSWNNNGDASSNAVKTFKTQAAGGMTPLLMALL